MPYQYDIFLSYNRKFPHGDWVNDMFYPFFKPYLEEALNIKNVKIFKDIQDIRSGQAWELKIKSALIHSKLMVSVFSPAYFNSDWCKKEFAIMDYRQRSCGCLTTENPNGLIIPLKLFDGEHFPDYVKSLQIFDCSSFNRIGAIKQSPLYIDFQGSLQKWVLDVAEAYNNVPDWNDSWKEPDWILKSWEELEKLDSLPMSKKPPIL